MIRTSLPPPSVYPRIDQGNLVAWSREQTGFPAIPGVRYPEVIHKPAALDYGPDFASRGIISVEPPRVLETTFQGGKNGIVTYELFPDGERTRLVLTHREIQTPKGFHDFGTGWTSHLAVLEEKLAGRSVPNFWALHEQSRDAVTKALG